MEVDLFLEQVIRSLIYTIFKSQNSERDAYERKHLPVNILSTKVIHLLL